MRAPISLLVLLTVAGVNAQKLSVEEAVNIGVQGGISVRTAESQVRKAQQQSLQALGSLGFRIDGLGIYERYLPSQQFGGPGSEQSEAKRASLSISYPIDFVGLNRSAAGAARANEDATREALSVEIIQTKFRIREAYYAVLRAEWDVRVQQEALDAARARLDLVQSRFNLGDVARFDVLRLETEVSRAEAAVEGARNSVALTKQILNNAMSRDVDTEIELETPFADVRLVDLPKVDLTEAELIRLASENRPDIRQLEKLLVAREFVTYTERGGLSPSLNVSATFTRSFDAGPFTRENQTTIGANLRFPLWDSGITRARVKAAREDEVQTKLALEQVRLGVALSVKSAVVRLRNATAQVAFARKIVEQQTEALRLAELRYNSGEGILLDVTTADADLRQALGGLVTARAEYLTAYAALQQAIGLDALPQPVALNPQEETL